MGADGSWIMAGWVKLGFGRVLRPWGGSWGGLGGSLLAGLGFAPIAARSTYGIYVRPVLGHIAQVAPFPKGFVQKEPHMLGKLLSSPANAVPVELV